MQLNKRQRLKLILFICGITVALAAFVILFINIFTDISQGHGLSINFIEAFGGLIALGLLPASIALQMHSKDIADRKPGFSGFLNLLSRFWFAFSIIIAIWCIIYFIFISK